MVITHAHYWESKNMITLLIHRIFFNTIDIFIDMCYYALQHVEPILFSNARLVYNTIRDDDMYSVKVRARMTFNTKSKEEGIF